MRPGLLYRSLFFATRPPLPVAAEMAQLREWFWPGRTHVGEQRLHITLFMLGHFDILPHGLIARAHELVSACTLRACRVAFDTLVAGTASALLVPSEPLRGVGNLQSRLAQLLAAGGIAPAPGWRFSPHVTLRYPGDQRGQTAIDPISWTADELVLIESRAGLGEHRTHGCWRLADY